MKAELSRKTEFLEMMRSRRVVRSFTDQPVADHCVWQILEMARWAPAAHNRRLQRYICVTEREVIRQLKMVTPGMRGLPAVLIVVCIDWALAGYEAYDKSYRNTYIDVGTAVENMLLTAHALGLGGWPMTSFSVSAVRELLNIPSHLRPEMFVGLGHIAPATSSQSKPTRFKRRLRIQELVQWGPFSLVRTNE